MGFNNILKNNLSESFSSEFINRIDEIIEFHSLKEKDIRQIIDRNLEKYPKSFEINVDEVIKASSYEEYGARKLTKLIKKQIENDIIFNVS